MADKKENTKLLTSKKKLDTGKWSYRGFEIAKNGTTWTASVLEGTNIPEDKSDDIVDQEMKSAKLICLEIDKILGGLSDKELNKNKPLRKSREQKEAERQAKANAVAKAKSVAYEIRKELDILSLLKKKEFNEKTTDAPNDVGKLKNGYKIGWSNGCYYDLPQIDDSVLEVINKDKKTVKSFSKKYKDLEFDFIADESCIMVKVTYKK